VYHGCSKEQKECDVGYRQRRGVIVENISTHEGGFFDFECQNE
jgi:hypothetical protein